MSRSTRSETTRWVLRMAPLFALFWVLLSGHFTTLLLVLGALSVALVCLLARRAGLTASAGASIPHALRLPRYLLWIGKEVLVSAVAVVRRVWSPRPDLRPAVAATPAAGMSELAQVTYANSITYTPGTLSLDVDEDQVHVHSLVPADLEALRAGAMLRRVHRLDQGRRAGR
ncbi:Na+/H+ antiporter subunit E [Actinophytocola gossypii]|uniref:Na+/H+ antiporter subunit E n=1 Tax=Actinophytocola gossypii TaxID=2812003 RepID=A0ABT2J989_9PSEU|nr:Na+/H+ antiporter subunit E [Actinophytocola gossypii]MCT2584430.1 Na+/H+ antiporter subunit E [Actinophytocola gossypii]